MKRFVGTEWGRGWSFHALCECSTLPKSPTRKLSESPPFGGVFWLLFVVVVVVVVWRFHCIGMTD